MATTSSAVFSVDVNDGEVVSVSVEEVVVQNAAPKVAVQPFKKEGGILTPTQGPEIGEKVGVSIRRDSDVTQEIIFEHISPPLGGKFDIEAITLPSGTPVSVRNASGQVVTQYEFETFGHKLRVEVI